MSNLIITIISIALAAIVALFGIYYGGQAYNNYAIKSQANTIVSQMSQLYNAGILYLTDTSQRDFTYYYAGALPATLVAGRFDTLLAPKYLSSMPVPPGGGNVSYVNATQNGGLSITLRYMRGCLPKGSFIYGMCGDTAGKNHTVISFQKPATCTTPSQATNISGVFAATDTYVNIAKEINKQTTIPAALSIDSTTQLPVATQFNGNSSAASELLDSYCPSYGGYDLDNGCVIRSDLKQIMCFFAK